MLIFRSEEHLERWLRETGNPRGATMTPQQAWMLAEPWYADKLSPDWHRKTRDEILAIFDRAGLQGDFWRG